MIPNELVPYDYATLAAWPGLAEAVVTDVETGRPAYFPVTGEDDHFVLLQATCAMPLLFPIYDYHGMRCLDGGCVGRYSLEAGAGAGVRPGGGSADPGAGYRRTPEKTLPAIRRVYKKYPAFVETMSRHHEDYNQDRDELFQAERKGRCWCLPRILPKASLG